MCVIKEATLQSILKWLTIEWIFIFALEKSGNTDLKISILSPLAVLVGSSLIPISGQKTYFQFWLDYIKTFLSL